MTKSEKLFQRWCKELNIYCHRFRDSKSGGGLMAQQPSDFFIFYENKLIFVEIKEFQGTNISYKSLRQIARLMRVKQHNIKAIFFFSTKDGNYILSIDDIESYIMNNRYVKSLSLAHIKQAGYLCSKQNIEEYLKGL